MAYYLSSHSKVSSLAENTNVGEVLELTTSLGSSKIISPLVETNGFSVSDERVS